LCAAQNTQKREEGDEPVDELGEFESAEILGWGSMEQYSMLWIPSFSDVSGTGDVHLSDA